jgi:DNA-binding Lrp family transcriptional regulator
MGDDLVTAVVLVKVETFKEKKVFSELQKIQEVKDLHQILGMYDIYIKLECGSYEDISMVVLEKIRNIPGVIDTRTLPEAKFATM